MENSQRIREQDRGLNKCPEDLADTKGTSGVSLLLLFLDEKTIL